MVGCIMVVMTTRITTIRNQAKVSASQHRRLTEVMFLCAEMYNALLESWIYSYRWWKRVEHRGAVKPSRTRFDLNNMIKGLRADRPDCAAVPSRVLYGVIDRHVNAVDAFYGRCKVRKDSGGRGPKAGYPRFKASRRWRTIDMSAYESMLARPGQGGKWWKLNVNGLPRIKFEDQGGRLAAALDSGGELKRIRITRRLGSGVEIHAVLKVPAPTPPAVPTNPGGVDSGLKNRVAVSDGRTFAGRVIDRMKIKRLQRKVARAKKMSKSRAKKVEALAREHRKAAVSRAQEDHRLARVLVAMFDGIAVEKLTIQNLMSNRRLADRIAQQSWASLIQAIRNQAAKAGSAFVEVNPAYTSQDCSECGNRQKIGLDIRDYDCPECFNQLCRDVNAARNICARGFPKSPLGWVRTDTQIGYLPMLQRAQKISVGKTSVNTSHAKHGQNEAGGRGRTPRPTSCGKHTARTSH